MVARPPDCSARRRFGRSAASVSTIAGCVEGSRGYDSNSAYAATTRRGDGRARYCRSLQGLKRNGQGVALAETSGIGVVDADVDVADGAGVGDGDGNGVGLGETPAIFASSSSRTRFSST